MASGPRSWRAPPRASRHRIMAAAGCPWEPRAARREERRGPGDHHEGLGRCAPSPRARTRSMRQSITETRPAPLVSLVRRAPFLLLSIALVSCGGGGARPRASTPPEAFYPIRGVVKGVAADRQSVTLDHEEIPGFMPRMEMEYVVADRALLDGVEPGDRVEGELRMRGRGLSIVRLHERRP